MTCHCSPVGCVGRLSAVAQAEPKPLSLAALDAAINDALAETKGKTLYVIDGRFTWLTPEEEKALP